MTEQAQEARRGVGVDLEDHGEVFEQGGRRSPGLASALGDRAADLGGGTLFPEKKESGSSTLTFRIPWASPEELTRRLMVGPRFWRITPRYFALSSEETQRPPPRASIDAGWFRHSYR